MACKAGPSAVGDDVTIQIVCDSGCDIPTSEVARLGIAIVPLSIRFGDEEFVDGRDLTSGEFWERCRTSATLPETSAPSPGAYQAAFDAAADAGATGVLVVSLSSALSGSFQSATVAAAAYDRVPVAVLDSTTVSMGQGLIATDLAEAALAGASLEELTARGHDLTTRCGVIAVLDTLDHLVKGGRIGGARALMGAVLSIKPMLKIEDGVVKEAGRQRTLSRALTALLDEARRHEPIARLAVIEGGSSQLDAFVAAAREIPTEHPLVVASVGPTIGTHSGPGVLALTWLEADGEPRH